jgi:hypothetical protein
MKQLTLAAPAVALLAFGAAAQTDTGTTATEGAASTEKFGTNWSLSVGTTFVDSANPGALRSAEDIGTGWQSLSQEDRDMVLADCTAFMAAHGTDAAADSAAADAGTESADTSTVDADAAATTGTAATDTTAQTDTATADAGAAAPSAGYDMAQMKAICEAAQGL